MLMQDATSPFFFSNEETAVKVLSYLTCVVGPKELGCVCLFWLCVGLMQKLSINLVSTKQPDQGHLKRRAHIALMMLDDGHRICLINELPVNLCVFLFPLLLVCKSE